MSSLSTPVTRTSTNASPFAAPYFPKETLATFEGGGLAGLGAGLIRNVLPTNQPPRVQSDLSQTPVPFTPPPRQDAFQAQYQPAIYAVVLQGLVATSSIDAASGIFGSTTSAPKPNPFARPAESPSAPERSPVAPPSPAPQAKVETSATSAPASTTLNFAPAP